MFGGPTFCDPPPRKIGGPKRDFFSRAPHADPSHRGARFVIAKKPKLAVKLLLKTHATTKISSELPPVFDVTHDFCNADS